MVYLLVVATLGEELRSRDRPGQKRKRAATLVRHGQSHVRTTQIGGWRSFKTVGHVIRVATPSISEVAIGCPESREDSLSDRVSLLEVSSRKTPLTRFYKGISHLRQGSAITVYCFSYC